jgi:hypothetical protein
MDLTIMYTKVQNSMNDLHEKEIELMKRGDIDHFTPTMKFILPTNMTEVDREMVYRGLAELHTLIRTQIMRCKMQSLLHRVQWCLQHTSHSSPISCNSMGVSPNSPNSMMGMGLSSNSMTGMGAMRGE